MKFLTLLLFLFLTSCALKAIPANYDINSFEKAIIPDDLGNGKVLIYSGADWKHQIDNTARLNVLIDNIALGQVRPKEYVIIKLELGVHKISLKHIDLVNMRSEHELIIEENTKIIEIKPTITSNKTTITNELPDDFNEFKYVIKR